MMGAPLSPPSAAENARPRTVSPRWQRPPASARCPPQTVAGHRGPERRRILSRPSEGGGERESQRDAQTGRDRDLFEQRLISATSPALRTKHVAASARVAAVRRGTERGSERHVARDREHRDYTEAQRITLREFVRQQREAQREWERFVNRGPAESPQTERDNSSDSDSDRELSAVRVEAARVAEAIEAAARSTEQTKEAQTETAAHPIDAIRKHSQRAVEVKRQKEKTEWETAAQGKAERETAEKQKAERETAERQKAERQKAEKETAEREKAVREQAEREKTEREKAERETAEKEKAERETAERQKAERQKAERETAEREKAVRQTTQRQRTAQCANHLDDERQQEAQTQRAAQTHQAPQAKSDAVAAELRQQLAERDRERQREALAAEALAAELRDRQRETQSESERQRAVVAELQHELAGAMIQMESLQRERTVQSSQLSEMRDRERMRETDRERERAEREREMAEMAADMSDMQLQVEVAQAEHRRALADADRARHAADLALHDTQRLQKERQTATERGRERGGCSLSTCALVCVVIVIACVAYYSVKCSIAVLV